MGRRPQPVPPIHTPEVAARAILRAAHEAPRELWLGSASLKAILGNMLAPGLLDRLLARQAWDGQMTAAEDPADRPDNLFGPVEGLHRTSGRFSDQARDRALALSSKNARQLVAAGAASIALLGGYTLARLLRPRR